MVCRLRSHLHRGGRVKEGGGVTSQHAVQASHCLMPAKDQEAKGGSVGGLACNSTAIGYTVGARGSPNVSQEWGLFSLVERVWVSVWGSV